MTNILIFRTDRIGDLLLTCPSIKTIKEYFPNSRVDIVTSEKNFEYAKTFDFINTVYLFPKKNFFKKINFFFLLNRNNYDYVYIFDGKDRSILTSCFLKSKKKFAKIVKSRHSYLCRIFKIKFSQDIFGKNLNDLHQNLLDYSNINQKIGNFDYLNSKHDNEYASKIPFKDLIMIHLDEKWFNFTYIKNYKDISPTYKDFTNFLEIISKDNNIVITTGLYSNDLIKRLVSDSKIIVKKNVYQTNINNNILIVEKPSFLDLESLLRKTKILISCHGALTHAAASLNIKIIDIVEKSKEDLVKRYSLYIKNYSKLDRENFKELAQNLLTKI